jgi:hypothetical protein
MATGFLIIWIFTYPIDLVLSMVVFVLINAYRRRMILKKLGLLHVSHVKGVKDVKGFLKSLFQSPPSSSMFGGENNPVRYYCMSCGNEHKECPKCSSKMKRAG